MREKQPLSIRARYSPYLMSDPEVGDIDKETLFCVIASLKMHLLGHYQALEEQAIRTKNPPVVEAVRTLIAITQEALAQINAPNASGDHPLLPADFDEIWTALYHSALTSPYRIYAGAVLSSLRAYNFITYLAAHAMSTEVRLAAEKQLRAEWQLAAQLRRHRRQAWRTEKPPTSATILAKVKDAKGLETWLHRQWSEIVMRYHQVVRQLREMRAEGVADRIEAYLETLGQPVKATNGVQPVDAALQQAENLETLLRLAQQPLEQLAENLQIISSASVPEAVYHNAVTALGEAVNALQLWQDTNLTTAQLPQARYQSAPRR